MPETINQDISLYILIGIICVIGIFLMIGLLFGLARFLNGFMRELRYLNNEIRRTDGEERRYWMRQKRRLWLSLIPFWKH